VSLVAFLRRNPSAGLLCVQLLGIVLYPLMESSPRGRALFGMFGLLVLGLALWVVRRGPWLTWLGVTLALPVVVLSAATVVTPHPGLTLTAAALESVFYLYAAGSLIAYMLQDPHVALDDLFAVGAAFTLLAWGFAYAFELCQGMEAGSFGYTGTEARTWTELLYVSVAVLSSVGLSDIVPLKPVARSIVMLESITGVMYIALVVSRLISLTGSMRRDRPPAA
jgi:hypothetical protein